VLARCAGVTCVYDPRRHHPPLEAIVPAKWRIAIPLIVVVVVLVGASVWMFAKEDAKGGGDAEGRKGGGGNGAAATSSTIPGQGFDDGLAEPVSGQLTLYGVPASQGALNALKQGFEAANPDAEVTIVKGPLLDLVSAIVKDPKPGAVIAPQKDLDALKGVSSDVGDPRPLGRNLFVIAVPKGNPKKVKDLDAFAADSGLRVQACGPASPYGNFGQLVLDEAEIGYDEKIIGSTCGKDAIDKLEKGELDAALVLRTAKRRTVQSVPVPEKVNIVIEYSIAQIVDDTLATTLVQYTQSEAGSSILANRGFKP
jgi:molybdate transport system substrate-binding protein